MSSSPTITNLYEVDDSPSKSSHEPENPPDIRVVSQSQTTEPFVHLLNAVALRVEDISTPHPHEAITQLEAYEDDGMNYQVPESSDNLTATGSTKQVLSPAIRNHLICPKGKEGN